VYYQYPFFQKNKSEITMNLSVNKTTDQFSSSNSLIIEQSKLLFIEQLHSQIPIYEVTSKNTNFVKERYLKKPQQDFQTLQP
ncbi:14031_t:CDS:1, partial [Cetraspora pellucida]